MSKPFFQKVAERIWCYKGRQVVLDELDKLRAELSNLRYELHDEIEKGERPLKFPIVKSKEETLDTLLREKRSIARYGDGEFKIMFGNSIRFHKYSPKLASRLKEVLVSNAPRILIGVPDVFGSLERFKPEDRVFWRRFLASYRTAVYELLSFERTYYDAFCSRPYISFADGINNSGGYFEKIKRLVRGKEVILIEGELSRVGIGNDLLGGAASVRRILGPKRDAFDRYDDLFKEATKHPKDVLFLLALGPAATVLAFDLANDGYQALDIGHIDIEYEWFLRKATKKMLIPGKYVNEVEGGHQTEDEDGLVDSDYRRQVIGTIL